MLSHKNFVAIVASYEYSNNIKFDQNDVHLRYGEIITLFIYRFN